MNSQERFLIQVMSMSGVGVVATLLSGFYPIVILFITISFTVMGAHASLLYDAAKKNRIKSEKRKVSRKKTQKSLDEAV